MFMTISPSISRTVAVLSLLAITASPPAAAQGEADKSVKDLVMAATDRQDFFVRVRGITSTGRTRADRTWLIGGKKGGQYSIIALGSQAGSPVSIDEGRVDFAALKRGRSCFDYRNGWFYSYRHSQDYQYSQQANLFTIVRKCPGIPPPLVMTTVVRMCANGGLSHVHWASVLDTGKSKITDVKPGTATEPTMYAVDAVFESDVLLEEPDDETLEHSALLVFDSEGFVRRADLENVLWEGKTTLVYDYYWRDRPAPEDFLAIQMNEGETGNDISLRAADNLKIALAKAKFAEKPLEGLADTRKILLEGSHRECSSAIRMLRTRPEIARGCTWALVGAMARPVGHVGESAKDLLADIGKDALSALIAGLAGNTPLPAGDDRVLHGQRLRIMDLLCRLGPDALPALPVVLKFKDDRSLVSHIVGIVAAIGPEAKSDETVKLCEDFIAGAPTFRVTFSAHMALYNFGIDRAEHKQVLFSYPNGYLREFGDEGLACLMQFIRENKEHETVSRALHHCGRWTEKADVLIPFLKEQDERQAYPFPHTDVDAALRNLEEAVKEREVRGED